MQHTQPPILAVLDGQGLDADDAAWASVADAAELALTFPGLSDCVAAELERLRVASLRAAGLPLRRRLQDGQTAG